MSIVLSEEIPVDWVTGRQIGLARQQRLDGDRASSARIHADDRAWESIVGAVAELAASRAWHLPMMAFDDPANRNGDPGWDFRAAFGCIDVKGVSARPWYFPVKDTTIAKQPGADFYVLVWCPRGAATCQVRGFVTRSEIEAAPWTPNIWDPEDSGRFNERPIPGRWLRLEPGLVHDAPPLMAAMRRGVPARLWTCSACALSLFAAVGRRCDLCDRPMVDCSIRERVCA